MFQSESKIEVRYCETDRMGIVHHSCYYPWFEIGRGDFFKQTGMTYAEVEKEGIMTPLIESNCRYTHSAQYGDTVIVRTSLCELTPTRIKYSYQVIRDSDKIMLAQGFTLHVFTTLEIKCVNIQKKNEKLWNLIKKLYDEGENE